MSGIEKDVDRLGRIVVPMEYRKKLGITEGSKIVFFLDGDTLFCVRFEKFVLCAVAN